MTLPGLKLVQAAHALALFARYCIEAVLLFAIVVASSTVFAVIVRLFLMAWKWILSPL